MSWPARIRATAATMVSLVVLAGAAGTGPAAAAQLTGVQIHPLWDGVTDAEADRQLDQVAATGAGMVRVDVGWASLEQDGKGRWGSWYLARLDRVVDRARAHGLLPLLTVFSTPCWASTAPEELRRGCEGAWWERGVTAYAPRDPRDYADVLSFLVRRYGPGVAWEIWNEPNLDAFFLAPDRAAAYVALLRAAHDAIKAADPGATVVGGALSTADAGFAERLYLLGAKGMFDVLSVHPYSGARSPLDPGDGTFERPSFAHGIPAVREAMLRHGDDRPLWLTEVGWNTSAVRGGPDWAEGVAEATQADHLVAAFRQMARWDYVDAMAWYALQDRSADAADPLANYGLLRADGTPKPAYNVFRFVATATRGAATGPPAGG